MNPILLAQLADGARKVFSNKYVLIGILVIVIFFAAKGGIKKLKKNVKTKKFRKNSGSDINRLALAIYNATDGFGTDEGKFLDAVREAKNKDLFDEVDKAYQSIPDNEDGLTIDEIAADELDGDDLRTYNDIVD